MALVFWLMALLSRLMALPPWLTPLLSLKTLQLFRIPALFFLFGALLLKLRPSL